MLGLFFLQSSKASKIKTYVGSDGKIHFTNSAGADSVLNFSKGVNSVILEYVINEIANGSSLSSTYTATETCFVFVVAMGMSSVSDSRTSSNTKITSTGTLVTSRDHYATGYMALRTAIYKLTASQTVTSQIYGQSYGARIIIKIA